jgi:hypothetical protein
VSASPPSTLDLTLLPGARELLELHARELPQRDDLCGAFCTSLALRVAFATDKAPDSSCDAPDREAPGRGTLDHDALDHDALDQDAVALAAGSVVSATPDPSILPDGEPGRRDYRLRLPTIADGSASGTTPQGLIDAVARLSNERVLAIPYAGPWTVDTLAGLFDLAAASPRPTALVANLATRHLWGSHPRHDQLLHYLLDGDLDGPAPDWDVGHFACIVARIRGPRGSVYVLADTYPSLGLRGVHAQPQERLAAALERREGPGGGVLALIGAEDAPAMRAGAEAAGLREGAWDNGTAAPDTVMPADSALRSP